MSPGDRVVLGVLGVWIAACAGVLVWRLVQNPLDARYTSLEQRLGGMSYTEGDIAAPEQSEYKPMHQFVARKPALWQELVAPPRKVVKKVERKPDLLQKLKGVRSLRREEIVVGDQITVKIRTTENPNGDWKTVGDKVRGLTIEEITPEAVVFGLEEGDKTYTAELPRT